MTIKYVRKLVWEKEIYFRIYTLSKVTFLHTTHPYGGMAYPRYIFAEGYILAFYTGCASYGLCSIWNVLVP